MTGRTRSSHVDSASAPVAAAPSASAKRSFGPCGPPRQRLGAQTPETRRVFPASGHLEESAEFFEYAKKVGEISGLTRRISPARTVTESDIALFAGLSADFSPVHSDAAYAARGVFGRRVAHGLLGMSLAEGLLGRTPGQGAPAAAWEWSFHAPLFAGDTIHAVAEPETASRRGDGPASERVTVYRHDGHALQRGRRVLDDGAVEPFADVVVRQDPAPPPAATTAPEHADETGVFFEDLAVGDRFTTPGYTLGAFEPAAFAGLTGDPSAGLFGLALVEGLKHCLAPDRGVGTPMASLSWRWRRARPLRVGDTVFLEVTIQGRRASRSRTDRGIVAQSIQLVAVGRGIVQHGQHVQMFRRRPEGSS